MNEAGTPTPHDVSFREGYAHGVEHAGGGSYSQAWRQFGTQTQNKRGQWVPSIPLPLFTFPHRHRCECKRTFWTMDGYRNTPTPARNEQNGTP
jgi:hypothetical protein